MSALSEYIDKHGDLRPWSYTKLIIGKCPFAANELIKMGIGKEFKGDVIRGQENLAAGIAIHEALENWHNANLMFDLENMPPIGTLLSKYPIDSSDWPKIISEYTKALDVFHYQDGESQFSGGNVIGAEKIVQVDADGDVVPWPDNIGYLKGTLDLLQLSEDGDTITITDYKRQHNILSPTKMAENFQLMLYSYLASRLFPQAGKIVCRLYFTRYGHMVEIERDTRDLKLVKETIDQVILGLRMLHASQPENSPQPIPGEQCDTCRFVLKCPLAQDDPDRVGVLKSFDDASRIATLVVLYESKLKAAKASLRTFTADNGEVTTSDGKITFGYRAQEKESWEARDIDGLVKTMLQEKIPVRHLLTADKRKLTKMIIQSEESNPTLHSKLTACSNKVMRTSFRSRKA